MARRTRDALLDERTCRMICPVAAGMAGVCLTAIGLLRVATALVRASTIADDLLSFDALLFLGATLFAYFATRRGPAVRLHLLERLADVCFIVAMVLLTLSCFIITYAIEPVGAPSLRHRYANVSCDPVTVHDEAPKKDGGGK